MILRFYGLPREGHLITEGLICCDQHQWVAITAASRCRSVVIVCQSRTWVWQTWPR